MGASLMALSGLLGGSVQDDDGDNDLDDSPVHPKASMNPGSIGPARQPNKAGKKAAVTLAEAEAKAKDIWDAEEIKAEDHGAADDPRPQPEYDTMFKQVVSSEDMYLGMSGRDPSSHWCEDMVVKINLPDHKMADCELDVTDTYLDLRTPSHRLGLSLPYPCDSKNGNAKFDKSKQQLIVTLRMMRDMDFLRDDSV